MQGKTLLVCTDRNPAWRLVSPVLAAAGNRVARASTTERAVALATSGSIDLVVLDWASSFDVEQVLAAAGERVPVVALSPDAGADGLIELVCRRGVRHLCAGRPDERGRGIIDPGELVVTVEKILRRDVFGLDKYLTGFGLELQHEVVVRAEDRDQVVERLAERVRAAGGGRRVVESVALVADELITNAVYNAPRDREGQPRYAHLCRRDKIQLDPTEYVRIEYGADTDRFGLAVTDCFGALTPETLRRSLLRCLTEEVQIEQKAGGAGIGLYTAVSHATQLVVNYQPGARTEIIALWQLARRKGASAAGSASVHWFEVEAPLARALGPVAGDEAAADGRIADGVAASLDDADTDAVPEPSVSLSESARLDVCAALLESSNPDHGLGLVGAARDDQEVTEPVRVKRLAEWMARVEVDLDPSDDQVPDWRMAAAGAGAWRADLSNLRGVHLLRRSDRPGLDTTRARIRGATALADGVEAAMTYLANWWNAAVLLCRLGDALLPWSSAGDLSSWDELCDLSLPLSDAVLARGSLGGDSTIKAADLARSRGWLAQRAVEPGVTFGPLRRDPMASELGDLMLGARGPRDGLAISLGFGGETLLVLFACRHQAECPEDPVLYRRLYSELAALIDRIEREGILSHTASEPLDEALLG